MNRLEFEFTVGSCTPFCFRIDKGGISPEPVVSSYPPFGIMNSEYNYTSGIAGVMEWIEEANGGEV